MFASCSLRVHVPCHHHCSLVCDNQSIRRQHFTSVEVSKFSAFLAPHPPLPSPSRCQLLSRSSYRCPYGVIYCCQGEASGWLASTPCVTESSATVEFAGYDMMYVRSMRWNIPQTVNAEYAIAKCLRDKQRVIYTSPIKALSNQKFRDLQVRHRLISCIGSSRS